MNSGDVVDNKVEHRMRDDASVDEDDGVVRCGCWQLHVVDTHERADQEEKEVAYRSCLQKDHWGACWDWDC